MNEAQLIKAIKAHIAKGEQHYISAGYYLAHLKERCPDQATFLALVKEKIGIGKSRAYELLQIADGRKTVEEVRADTADRQEKHRLSVTNGQDRAPALPTRVTTPDGKLASPERAAAIFGAAAVISNPIADAWERADEDERASFVRLYQAELPDAIEAQDDAGDAEVMPTEEEADESYQKTLYDHACSFLERMTEHTRERFFAHVRGKYRSRVADGLDIPEGLRALIYKRMVEGLSLILASPRGRDLNDDFLREVFEEFLSKRREVLPACKPPRIGFDGVRRMA
jgi:hypothetical protein